MQKVRLLGATLYLKPTEALGVSHLSGKMLKIFAACKGVVDKMRASDARKTPNKLLISGKWTA